MLILAMRKNQRIRIGNDITIIWADGRAGEVKVGIEAPRDVPITREPFVRVEEVKEVEPK